MVITKTLSPLDHSQTKTNESAETRKPQLLCIDDDPDIAQALEMALSNLEIELTCAFSGQQGIWNALTNKPDLILTDWLMPNGSGEDLVTTLKRNKNTVDIPIIVLSCLGGGRQEQRLFSMGVDGFVQKPISYATLISEIGRHITLPQIGFASTQPDGNDDE